MADGSAASLREAIGLANASPGADSITFGVSGTILLTTPLPAIADDLTITGNGAANTIIDGGGTLRPFAVLGGTLTLQDLAVRNGYAKGGNGGGGGGVRGGGGGAAGLGGAVFVNAGGLVTERVRFSGNRVQGGSSGNTATYRLGGGGGGGGRGAGTDFPPSGDGGAGGFGGGAVPRA